MIVITHQGVILKKCPKASPLPWSALVSSLGPGLVFPTSSPQFPEACDAYSRNSLPPGDTFLAALSLAGDSSWGCLLARPAFL